MRGTALSPSMVSPVVGGATEFRFSPLALGDKLVAWWDAEEYASLTLASGLVTTWAPKIGAGNYTQATTTNKPAYDATGFNGRPCVTFDGVDNFMAQASGVGPFPTGASIDHEIFILEQNDTADADTAGDIFFTFGGATQATCVRMSRAVSGGNMRRTFSVGSGAAGVVATETTVARAVPHLFSARIYAGGAAMAVDKRAEQVISVAHSISSSRARLGSSEATSPGSYANTRLNSIILTTALTAAERAAMKDWGCARGSIT